MLAEIFKAFLITSIAGSALAVIITLLKSVTKKIFGYSWHYYIWLAVLFVMIVPVRFSLPQSGADIPVANTQAVQTEHITETAQNIVNDGQIVNTANTVTTAQKATAFIGKILDNRMNYLGIIWLLGTAFMLMTSINGYIRLIMKIHKNSVVISCPEASNYTDKKITVRSGNVLSSPFMLGVFRPTLVLPDRELSTEQLNNILRHEMTHFRRKDILYKWFTLFVRSVHWFNPIVYYVARQINNECEISCDLSVVSQMNSDEQINYVNTILSLASSDRVKRVPLTTQMASGKNLSIESTVYDSDGTVVFESKDLKDPQSTVNGFFKAFAESDFILMKNYCTEECRKTFFGDGYCFGMTRADIRQIDINPYEYLKSSNDFNVFVTVDMTPHEISVFDAGETSASFYVILQRQPNGRFLIDKFATGL